MTVHGDEVAALLRRAIAGQIPVKLAYPEATWDRAYAGDVEFLIDGWRVIFFNDCDELDYCDSAIAPDGRAGDFDSWWGDQSEPTSLLSIDERAALEGLLREAR